MKHLFVGEVVTPSLLLSVEEEAIAANDIAADSSDLQQSADELGQSSDMAESLEDVLIVADAIKEPTDDVTASLVAAVSDMAAAGMGGDQLIVDPSLSTESIEGIKNAIKKIWDSIVAFLKHLWGQVTALFNQHRVLFESYKSKLEQQLAVAKSGKVGKQEGDVTVANAAMVEVVAVKTAAKWIEGCQHINDVMAKVLTTGTEENVVYGNHIVDFISKAKTAVVTPDAPKVMDGVAKDFIANIVRSKSVMRDALMSQGSSQDKTIKLFKDLPGAYEIIFDTGSETKVDPGAEGSRLSILKALTHGRYSMESKLGAKPQAFNMPDSGEAVKILEAMLGVTNTSLAYLGKGKKSLEDVSKRLQTVTDDLVKASDKVTDSGAKPYVTVILTINKHFNLVAATFGNQVLNYNRKQVGATVKAMQQCLKTGTEAK